MTPTPTKVILVATLSVTAAAVTAVSVEPRLARAGLVLLTLLFAARVVGQLHAIRSSPTWLPPASEWNFLPYRALLPIQLALLVVMGVLVAEAEQPRSPLVWASAAYVGAMAVRYALRMRRRPDERWFGGTIPIVFHCVLAAFLFVLGSGVAGR